MDFFDRQDKAHRNTKLLVVYFVAGVAMLIVAVYLAAVLLFTGFNSRRHHRFIAYDAPAPSLWNPHLFVGVTLGTLAVIVLGSLFKTAELSRGGSAVATMLGGRPVSPNTADPDERKLLNVVEEMAIAAGMPVPEVYLLPAEPGINAFAAGHTSSDAVVAVTAGAIKLLSRDELQGVIGHEFSHILNGDMRLNLRLMGIVFGILCLTVIGRILLQTRSRGDRNPLPVLGICLLVLGWAGVFFGRLIQAAVSRQREFLADASAVQFTRNPSGLAGALKKIGGLSCGSKLNAAHADEASHMFFGNGMGESFLHLMDTHPPLAQRIRAIEPEFDGNFPRVAPDLASLQIAAAAAHPVRQPDEIWENMWSSPWSGFRTTRSFPQTELSEAPPPRILTPQGVIPRLGNPDSAHLRYAEELRISIPPSLQQAAREAFGASALIYSLLLSDDQAARDKQLQELAALTSAGVCQEALRLHPEVQAVAAHTKLPLVDLALPALRELSARQFQQFRTAVQALVESDGEIELFEYVLQKIVLRHLEPHFVEARKPIIQYYAIKPLAADCSVLLSALARLGQDEPEQIQFAFDQGAQPLGYAAQVELRLLPATDCELAHVDAALNRFAQAAPQIKKNVLTACTQTVAADGVIREIEAELVRAIADTLDCPMPPFV
jgi:Zn-dependent protease with chaperone function